VSKPSVKQEPEPPVQPKKPSLEASKGTLKGSFTEATKTATKSDGGKKPVKSAGLDWSKAKVKDTSNTASQKSGEKSVNTAEKTSKPKQSATDRAPSVSSSTSETKPKVID
jgi:hypothetical protein